MKDPVLLTPRELGASLATEPVDYVAVQPRSSTPPGTGASGS